MFLRTLSFRTDELKSSGGGDGWWRRQVEEEMGVYRWLLHFSLGAPECVTHSFLSVELRTDRLVNGVGGLFPRRQDSGLVSLHVAPQSSSFITETPEAHILCPPVCHLNMYERMFVTYESSQPHFPASVCRAPSGPAVRASKHVESTSVRRTIVSSGLHHLR